MTDSSRGAAPSDVTLLLGRVRAGERQALSELIPLVYDELKVLAHGQLRKVASSETLNTTALVHEAYAKLAGQAHPEWADRCHFLGVAATAMRHVAVDYARAKRTAKRGGGRSVVTLDGAHVAGDQGSETVLAIDEALEGLSSVSERLARVVECRFFGGLTDAETATALGVTERTVRRDWKKARAWLYRALSERDGPEGTSS